MRATITLLGLQLKMPRSVHHYIDNDRDSLCGRSGQINNMSIMSMSHSITVFTPAFWILLGFITRLPLLYIGTCIQGGQFHVIMPIAIIIVSIRQVNVVPSKMHIITLSTASSQYANFPMCSINNITAPHPSPKTFTAQLCELHSLF